MLQLKVRRKGERERGVRVRVRVRARLTPLPSNSEIQFAMPMATSEPSTDSLPLIDLRLLSQSELFTLSLSGATPSHIRNYDDSMVPKIDRSIFNESAGSRKQTFSKLRLRKPNSTVPLSSLHTPRIPEPLDEENSQIIGVLEQLFGVESSRNRRNDDVDGRGPVPGSVPVPVPVEFKQPLPQSFPHVPIGGVVEGSQKKRRRGRPRKNENLEERVEDSKAVNGNVEGKSVEFVDRKGVTVDTVVKTEEIVNVKGFVDGGGHVVDSGDPFGEELKRRTQGLETESQLLQFLETLNGEWGSQRKKRRIVPASDLGDSLPAGWKIVVTLLRRAGRAWVVCRRYISPDGHQFESCKEVSAYLLSSSGVEDISRSKSSYTHDMEQVSHSINIASESSVVHSPAGDMKTNANASYSCLGGVTHSNHEKQATVSSSIGRENFNSDMALGIKLGDTAGEAVRDLDHQTEDKQVLMADKNDGSSVQGCSLGEARVCNALNEKLVGAIKASDAACNLYIPLVFSTPFSNNNSDHDQVSDEINAATCIKDDINKFTSQDRNTEHCETVPSGNKQAHVDNNGLGLPVQLVEENIQNMGFERSMLTPNSEEKTLGGKNLEDRHLINSLDMEIRDSKPVEDENQQIICSEVQPEIKALPTNVKMQSSSEGCSLVPSQNDHSMDKTQTSMLKDSAEEIFFDSDLFSSSIDDRPCFQSDYIGNISFSSCTQVVSESDGVDYPPYLKVTRDVNDDHIPPNEEAVTSCFQERGALRDQNCTLDSLLQSSESNLFALTGNQHPSAFHDNVHNFSVGTFDALEAVDVDCMDPLLGSSNVAAVDEYTSANIKQGKSQGSVSVALGGSILFDKRIDDGVTKVNESCSPEKAKKEVEIFQTTECICPNFASCQIDP
ncbi:hypothetical protein RJT34_09893 [Clitoria ternatea]|uniref:MBD domain-containing protein n=1 Tax=Clitoria ternatea TaxID=43366 RepID=A0AAN9PUW1_CLITE